MPPTKPVAAGNRLLAALPSKDRQRVLAGCEVVEIGSTPTLLNSWNQVGYPPEKREKLMALELKLCTLPELLGVGHHLFCVARKK